MRADVSERMRTKNIRNKTNYIMQIYQDIPGKKLVRSFEETRSYFYKPYRYYERLYKRKKLSKIKVYLHNPEISKW